MININFNIVLKRCILKKDQFTQNILLCLKFQKMNKFDEETICSKILEDIANKMLTLTDNSASHKMLAF